MTLERDFTFVSLFPQLQSGDENSGRGRLSDSFSSADHGAKGLWKRHVKNHGVAGVRSPFVLSPSTLVSLGHVG